MEVFWGVFLLVMGNIIINAIVANHNIKNRATLDAFVRIADAMNKTYRDMALTYNNVADGFNEAKRVSDIQGEIITFILVAMMDDPHLAPAAQEWLSKAEESAKERMGTSVKFTTPSQI